MSKYNECIRDGKYALASAGEVCSVETAKARGFFHADAYYKGREYNGLRTYNPTVDSETARSEEICRENVDGSQAYAACSLAVNAGPGYMAKAGSPGTCVTHACPPGFVDSRGTCKKPLSDALVSKRARCDERWTDWFMVPNYHLGNAFYSSNVGQCMAPCPSGQVPGFATDPVDGAGVDFTSSDDLGVCIDKQEYFDGKYAETAEHCPVAWIHRVGVTAREIEQSLQEKYDAVVSESGGYKNNYMVDQERDRKAQAAAIVAAAARGMEAVAMPNDMTTAACKTIASPERIREAYNICEQVQQDEVRFMKRLEEENGDGALAQEQKTMVLKTACNALFCNEKWDPYTAETIGREPLCFQNIKDVNMDASAAGATPSAPTADSGKLFFRHSIGRSFSIVMICVFGTLLYFFVTLFLWPKIILPIWAFIKKILTGWKVSSYEGKFAELEEIVASPVKDTMGPALDIAREATALLPSPFAAGAAAAPAAAAPSAAAKPKAGFKAMLSRRR
jgi:hypothetical protein